MRLELELALVGVVGGLVSGAVVAWVSSSLSRRGFVSQQWWERKAAAYIDVISQLAELRIALVDYRVELSEPDADHATLLKHVERWEKVADALDQLANQEGFLLSVRATKSLRSLQEKRNQVSRAGRIEVANLIKEMMALSVGVKVAIDEIAKIAHEDLDVPERLRGRGR